MTGVPVSRRVARIHWQTVALVGLIAVTTAVNLWWVAAHRTGLPFEIDEAGYLQRAVRDADALRSGGLGSLWSTYRSPDPQAPLLPMLAGVFRWATGAGTYRMFVVLQGFYVITIVSTYWGARRLASRNLSLVAALMVAAVPAIDVTSRTFLFALPATAMLTATLATQLHADAFRSRRLSALWGLTLGLSALSRTVVLAMVPAVLLAAVVSLLLSSPRRRQVANVSLGLVIALVVAGSWYAATWRPVLRYLTTYGYGSKAGSYGSPHPLLSFALWSSPLDFVTKELFLPLTIALALTAVVGLVSWWWRRQRRNGDTDQGPGSERWTATAARVLRRPQATLWIFLGGVYLVLMSSPNNGSYFELPLLPPLCMLAASVLERTQVRARVVLVATCAGAAILSFVTTAGLGPAFVGVPIGPLDLTAFDGRGDLLAYAAGTGVVCAGANPCAGSHAADVTAYLQRWNAPSQDAAVLLHTYATEQGCQPIVFFANQDPFFNTNTVDLAYQLAYASGLPTGVLETPGEAGESLVGQLQDPARGQPNLVITGPLPRYNVAPPVQPGGSVRARAHAEAGYQVYGAFSPLPDQRAGIRALQEDGFGRVASLRLPDGRSMAIWWRHRGDCTSGP